MTIYFEWSGGAGSFRSAVDSLPRFYRTRIPTGPVVCHRVELQCFKLFEHLQCAVVPILLCVYPASPVGPTRFAADLATLTAILCRPT